MTITHQLKEQAASLRLKGMAETLELRLQQAREREVGYEELLTMLLTDELERRAAAALDRRLRKAGFDEHKTLEDFDFTFNPTIPVRRIKDLAGCGYIARHEHLVLVGPPGVGKSHLAQALGHQACRQGYDVRFTSAARLFKILHAADPDPLRDRLLKKIIQVELLIIDDFGLRPLTLTQAEDFYEIIAERYMKRSIIITSNRALEEWVAIFPDPLMAHSALDRIAHNAHQIVMEGESYRKAQRAKRFGSE